MFERLKRNTIIKLPPNTKVTVNFDGMKETQQGGVITLPCEAWAVELFVTCWREGNVISTSAKPSLTPPRLKKLPFTS